MLDLLTPTENAYAVAWRERCRLNLANRAAQPKLRAGQVVVFDQLIAFTDDAGHQRMIVVVNPPGDRKLRFRPEGGGGLYRISGLKTRAYSVEGAPPKKCRECAPDLFEMPSSKERAP